MNFARISNNIWVLTAKKKQNMKTVLKIVHWVAKSFTTVVVVTATTVDDDDRGICQRIAKL